MYNYKDILVLSCIFVFCFMFLENAQAQDFNDQIEHIKLSIHGDEYKLDIENLYRITYNKTHKNELLLSMRAPFFERAIEQISEQKNETRYNRYSVKDFHFLRINPNDKEVQLSAKCNYRNYTNRPFVGGVWMVLSVSADTEGGVHFFSEDGCLNARARIYRIDTNASEYLEPFVALFKPQIESLLVDVANRRIQTISFQDALDRVFVEYKELLDKKVLTIRDVKYQPDAITLLIQFDESKLNDVDQRKIPHIREIKNIQSLCKEWAKKFKSAWGDRF